VEKGAFASHIIVKKTKIAKLPTGVSVEAGAHLPYASYIALNSLASLKPESKVHIKVEEGFLKEYLKEYAMKNGLKVTFSEDEVQEKSVDMYLDCANVVDGIRQYSARNLSIFSDNGFEHLRYDIKGDDFVAISSFAEENKDVAQAVSKKGEWRVVKPKDFEFKFPEALKDLAAKKAGPYLFDMNGLFEVLAEQISRWRVIVEKEKLAKELEEQKKLKMEAEAEAEKLKSNLKEKQDQLIRDDFSSQQSKHKRCLTPIKSLD